MFHQYYGRGSSLNHFGLLTETYLSLLADKQHVQNEKRVASIIFFFTSVLAVRYDICGHDIFDENKNCIYQ